MPNNLVSANDLFGAAAVAVAAAAMSNNSQSHSQIGQQQMHHHQDSRLIAPSNQISPNEPIGMSSMPNQHQVQQSRFDEQNFNRFMYDHMPSLNTKNSTSTPNNYGQASGFPHLASPIHQQNHLSNPLMNINNPSSGSSSTSSSSQFASMSSSSSPDYLNSYKQMENNYNLVGHPGHCLQSALGSQTNHQSHMNTQHMAPMPNQTHLQSPQSGHLMSPHQNTFNSSLAQQMPQMNQMNNQNLIYPWMRPATNVKASKFTGFDHKRTRQTYSRHQTLELEKEFHFNK